MRIPLTTSISLGYGEVSVAAVSQFLDALPGDAVLSFRTYQGDQREGTSGGLSITASWTEER